MKRSTELQTRCGVIKWPAFVPVTTLTGKFQLDELVRPFLGRMAQCALVSMHYAKGAKEKMVDAPLMLDSGGFGLLREGSRLEEVGGLGHIVTIEEDGSECVISPLSVLQRQEELADVGFTLDFPIPPGTPKDEAELRMRLTLGNAAWAVRNRRRKDLPLFGGVVGETADDFARMAREMVKTGVDGLAVGGMVPRAADWAQVEGIVGRVLEESKGMPVHVFGIGKPERIRALFEMGVTSCDSSSYVRSAAEGQVWGRGRVPSPDMATKLHAALANLACATGKVPLGVSTSTAWLEVGLKEGVVGDE